MKGKTWIFFGASISLLVSVFWSRDVITGASHSHEDKGHFKASWVHTGLEELCGTSIHRHLELVAFILFTYERNKSLSCFTYTVLSWFYVGSHQHLFLGITLISYNRGTVPLTTRMTSSRFQLLFQEPQTHFMQHSLLSFLTHSSVIAMLVTHLFREKPHHKTSLRSAFTSSWSCLIYH